MGQTHKSQVLYRVPDGTLRTLELFRAVNAATDPQLASRAVEVAPEKSLNAFQAGGKPFVISVPFVYHDPHRRVFALVLPEALRYRELEERAELMKLLADDKTVDVPVYVSEFSCVYGPRGLLGLLEQNAAAIMSEQARLDDRAKDLETMAEAIARRQAELDAREQVLVLAERQRRDTGIDPVGDVESDGDLETNPTVDPELEALLDVAREEEATTGLHHRIDFEATTHIKLETIPVESVHRNRRQTEPLGAIRMHDALFDRWVQNQELTLKFLDEDGLVHLAATVGEAQRHAMLGQRNEVRFQTHLLPSFPLPALLVGPLKASGAPNHVVFLFNVSEDKEVEVLEALAGSFQFVIDLYDEDYDHLASRKIGANLEGNVRRGLEVAAAHLTEIPGDRRSYHKAVLGYASGAHNVQPPWGGEFSTEALGRLASTDDVGRAYNIVKRFSDKEGEDYLLARGYPLSVWAEQRNKVIARAGELGLAKPDPADKARMKRGQPTRPFRIDSESAPVVSGEISTAAERSRRASKGHDPFGTGSAEIRAYQQALALCERGEERALPDIFEALRDLLPDQVASLLGRVIRFGAAAVPFLVSSLTHAAPEVRQGSAMALSLLGDPRGIAPICELLCREQTPVWRESARALGEVGAGAIPALMSHLPGANPEREERLAWALAFVASRQGVSVLSGLQGAEAARVGQKAALLMAEAADDNRRVLGKGAAQPSEAVSRHLLMSTRST